MNTQQFITAYNESRNGADHFCRNSMYPKFLYSNGVQECAAAGCYWLLDILGTELPREFAKNGEYSALIICQVYGGKATITAEFKDGEVGWRKAIDFTDMPSGDWKFYVTCDEGTCHCILLSEY